MMIIAQISDMHVAAAGDPTDAAYNGAAHFARAIDHLNGLNPRPDLVVASGDLVATGTAAQYHRLADQIRSLQMPLYLIPGNHDDRETMRSVLTGHDYLPREGFLNYVVPVGPLRLIMLDTSVPGASHGELCAARLDWLESALAEAEAAPTLIFMHHPPFASGLRKMDQTRLVQAAGFGDLVDRHSQIERILCGHLHRAISRRFKHTMIAVCPSTTFHLALNLTEDETIGMAPEPAACYLHYWTEESGLVSHTSYIGIADQQLMFDGKQWLTPG